MTETGGDAYEELIHETATGQGDLSVSPAWSSPKTLIEKWRTEMKSILRMALSAGSALILAGLLAGAASADITDNTNASTQSGTNSSISSQTSASLSGAATATDEGVALSGDAGATTVFQGAQTLALNLWNQTDASGSGDIDTNTNTAVQIAANALLNGQMNGAASGAASAEDSGSSTTGAASSTLANIQSQIQALLQNNQSLLPTP